MNPRIVVDHFVVADVAVAFAGHVDHARVGVVVRNQDSGRRVDHFGTQRITEIRLAPNGVLPIRLARESGGKQTARVTEESHFAGFTADVTQSFLLDSSGAGVDDAQLLVFTRGGQQTSVTVERHGINHIRVAFDDVDRLAGSDVPNENQVIRSCAEQDVIGRRMPLDVRAASFVPAQINQALLNGSIESAFGDVPQFNGAVLRAGSNDVIVERVPLDVQDGTRVTGHFTDVQVQSAGLLQRQDDEGASAGHFRDDGQEFRVDGAAVRVVRVFRDVHVLVTLVLARRLPVDVPEFRRAHATERQLPVKGALL